MPFDFPFDPRTLLTEAEDRDIRDQVHSAIAAGGAAPQIRRRILDLCQRAIDANAYVWLYSTWHKDVPYPHTIANFNSHGSSLRTGVAILRRYLHIGLKRPHREVVAAAKIVHTQLPHTVLQADMYGPDWHDPANADAIGYKRQAALNDMLVSAWPVEIMRGEVVMVAAMFSRGPAQPAFARRDAAITDAFMFHALPIMRADLPTQFLHLRRLSPLRLLYFICAVFEAEHAAGPDHADVARINGTSPERSKKMLRHALQTLGFKNRKRLWSAWATEVLGKPRPEHRNPPPRDRPSEA